jgi:uncharacterized protein YkwD
MMKKRILAVGLAATLTFGATIPALANSTTAEYYSAEAIAICQTAPTMLTDEQLSELVTTAPDISDTRSSMTMTNRRMTAAELTDWSDEYWELGGINAFELEIIRLINIERATADLHPLAISPQLSMAARFHSQEMADLQFFSHRSDIYGRGTARANMFGHVNQQMGFFGAHENIHGGALTPERAMQGWMNSPGHRRAILDPDALTIGIGSVRTSEFGSGRTTAKYGF